MSKKYKKRTNSNNSYGFLSFIITTLVIVIGYIYRDSVFSYIPVLIFCFITAFIIVFFAKIFHKNRIRNQYIRSPLYKIDKMSGEEFERYLKAYFEKIGYKVSLTSKSHDYGVDLVLKDRYETIIVQAKRYKNKVGITAIQEIVAAKEMYNADRCMVITNSFFSKSAQELAQTNNVELWDREYLKDFKAGRKNK